MNPPSLSWWTSEFWGVTYRPIKISYHSRGDNSPKLSPVIYRHAHNWRVNSTVTACLLWLLWGSGAWWGTGTRESLWPWWWLERHDFMRSHGWTQQFWVKAAMITSNPENELQSERYHTISPTAFIILEIENAANLLHCKYVAGRNGQIFFQVYTCIL